VSLAQHNHVTETFSAYRADDPLDISVLPRRSIGRADFFDPEALYPLLKHFTVNRVVVAEQVARRFVVRKGFNDLLCGPASVQATKMSSSPRFFRSVTHNLRQRGRALFESLIATLVKPSA